MMAIFNLPAEAALAVVLGSVRKDGLAIGLPNGDLDSLKLPLDTSVQVLTAVYLAGVLLPCLVTVLTVVREMGSQFVEMVGRQACFAVLCVLYRMDRYAAFFDQYLNHFQRHAKNRKKFTSHSFIRLSWSR